jgi:uncharacterized protein YdiU (UPF0061 family)
VVRAQAELIAKWMLVGFIHGVMNTGNMSIAGETIDYGPCAFMDAYDPGTVFSAIDRQGRYAYFRQPAIGEWNLARLAECLLPLLSDDTDVAIAEAEQALDAYQTVFERAYQGGLRRKLGLLMKREGDVELGRDLLQAMGTNSADFTLTFRRLSGAASVQEDGAGVRSLFANPSAYDEWVHRDGDSGSSRSRQTQRRVAMQAVNPAFIPRNHRVEAVIRAAVDEGDFAPFHELVTVLSNPFEAQPAFAQYMDPSADHEWVLQTFCGT